MKRWLFLVLALGLVGACKPKPLPSQAQMVYVKKAPPAAKKEPRPPPPAGPMAGWFWKQGHWGWRPGQKQHVWMKGQWTKRPKPGGDFVPGHWAQRKKGHVWVKGHWK